MNSNTKFIFCALGIFVSYFYFGILQEKVTKGKYPVEVVQDDGTITEVNEKFTFSLALVFGQCFVSYLFAKGAVLIKGDPEDRSNGLTKLYGATSLTYLLGMVCSNMALQWVPYPTQVIGKSAKPIPVMLLGVLIGKKSYTLKKYFFVLLVVIGVVLFMYKDQANIKSNESSFGFGELLLIMSLTMDGLTGGMQEVMRAKPAKPTGEQMMLNMNFWSCIYVVLALVFTGDGLSFVAFAKRHPVVLFNIGMLSIAGAVGQHFIYIMVAQFGPLPVAIVTTTRKFVTVLASVVFFGNTLITRQWVAAMIVFGSLFLDAYYSKSGARPDKEIKK
ncbi:solute carrier family 35 member B1 homolog [Atheta coriaria]|uniref:solute carrier family 35 member B1 homolog n=1 Tax=Dalotia coriaria TaxID=877792 RepID=UPI0031F431B4